MNISNHVKSLAAFLALIAFFAMPANAELIDFVATLDGSQEVPPNVSPATGLGTFVLDTNANTLSFNIQYSGLVATETASHIHGPAPAGVNGPVIFPLPLNSPKIGVWNYPEAQEQNITAGLTYVNIHTTVYPGGEIRGQIVRKPEVSVPEYPGIVLPVIAVMGLVLVMLIKRRNS
ncbi:MAG TPA: CHRD domain-containing protein [Candidatus Methanoperedenaceae archaeon]|nr:CHRD domain-containing protein [Candidatus Methanoperedenaceae archaeon]